jgi:hypothetical protein
MMRAGAGWFFFDSPEREPLGSNDRHRRPIALAAMRTEVNTGGLRRPQRWSPMDFEVVGEAR